jgi:hypothetical protein
MLRSSSALGFAAVVLVGSVIVQRCVSRVRHRLTYPNTGTASYPTPRRRHRWLTAALTAASVITLVVLLQSWVSVSPSTPGGRPPLDVS